MNIRLATVGDAKIVAELNTHVHQIHVEQLPHAFKPPHVDDEMVALYDHWINQDNANIWIAEDADKPIGYIYAIIYSRPENPFKKAMRYILIDQMSVNPEYYGTGIADMLMQVVTDWAQQEMVDRIILDVWTFNERAKRFYEKQGFVPFIHRMELMLE